MYFNINNIKHQYIKMEKTISLEKLVEIIVKPYTFVKNENDFDDMVEKHKILYSLSDVSQQIKYDLTYGANSILFDELILISPICFKLDYVEGYKLEYVSWFNILNSLLIVLNNDYVDADINNKKKILQMANNKCFNMLTEDFDKDIEIMYINIVNIFMINLILVHDDAVNIYYSNDKIKNKYVVLLQKKELYHPVINFENRYWNVDNCFVQQLMSNSGSKIKYDKIKEIKELQELKVFDTVMASSSEKSSSNTESTIESIKMKENIKCNSAYVEILTENENNKYISEVDNVTEKRMKETNSSDKGKQRKNKNIFVPFKTVDVCKKTEESVFKKTVCIDKKRILEINSNIKTGTKLEQLQEWAIELSIEIFGGSTKDGKPKNKTKNTLIDEIKKLL